MVTRSEATSARTLNRLIVACKDDISTLDAAARVVVDPTASERLSSQSDQRASFVRDLETAVTSFGGTPARHRSLRAAASTLLAHLRVLFGGKSAASATRTRTLAAFGSRRGRAPRTPTRSAESCGPTRSSASRSSKPSSRPIGRSCVGCAI